jgi:ComF family protein
MWKTINTLLQDFVGLFFPRVCLACDSLLPYGEPFLCLDCQAHLPQADFHLEKNNPFSEKLRDRVNIDSCAALFLFTKKSKTQHLIHRIKYEDKKEAAFELGRILGQKLMESPHFQALDYIIPVPMHPRKEILRGYNQAKVFAEGLSDTMQIPLETSILIKTKMTDSQTRKTRRERMKNIEDVFAVKTPSVLVGKNILIVDDVMTTGATLEACAQAILEKTSDVKLSFATIAFAKK